MIDSVKNYIGHPIVISLPFQFYRENMIVNYNNFRLNDAADRMKTYYKEVKFDDINIRY